MILMKMCILKQSFHLIWFVKERKKKLAKSKNVNIIQFSVVKPLTNTKIVILNNSMTQDIKAELAKMNRSKLQNARIKYKTH